MSESRRALAGLFVVGLFVTACGNPPASGPPSGGASATSPASAASSTSPSATVAGIDHPTGATDVILRVSEVGGFLPIELVASRVPAFTLYGDGTLIVQRPGDGGLNAAPGPTPALITAKLDEAQVQEILETALTRGGLAIARESYENAGIMDAPTTVFEVQAGGLDKSVRVLALGFEEPQPGPDTVARSNLQELRVFLDGIAATAVQGGAELTAPGHVGVLIELESGQPIQVAAKDWPWDDLAPADFVAPQGGGDVVSFPEHQLSTEQLAALGIEDLKGGYNGVVLDAPGGKRYSLVIRPLLPDQAG